MRSVRYATVATTSQVTAVHHGALVASGQVRLPPRMPDGLPVVRTRGRQRDQACPGRPHRRREHPGPSRGSRRDRRQPDQHQELGPPLPHMPCARGSRTSPRKHPGGSGFSRRGSYLAVLADTADRLDGTDVVLRSLRGVRPGHCLLYTSDAADEEDSVDLGGRRIIKKKKKKKKNKR